MGIYCAGPPITALRWEYTPGAYLELDLGADGPEILPRDGEEVAPHADVVHGRDHRGQVLPQVETGGDVGDPGVLVSGKIQPLLGKIQPLLGNIQQLSGNVQQLARNIQLLSGNIQQLLGNIQPLSGNIQPLSGRVERTPVSLHPNCQKHLRKKKKYQG
jgi:hypothetical protein